MEVNTQWLNLNSCEKLSFNCLWNIWNSCFAFCFALFYFFLFLLWDPHLLDVLKIPHFDDPEAGDVQLSCSVWVDLYVQFLSVLTQQVSEKQHIALAMKQATSSTCETGHMRTTAVPWSTLAPRCRSPQSWRWRCTTTCPSSPRSHWRVVSGLAGWCLGSPHCPEKFNGT